MQTESVTAERPLITFALFAYNQERYIREAVQGAFAQVYEPLEIILSDDCSTDRTFEIMQEMAATYSGTHSVTCRKNKSNVGLVDHVCAVADIATGRLFVLAAGDDVSYPTRTERIVAAWGSQCDAVFSACDLIDDNGALLRNNWAPSVEASLRLPWLKSLSTPRFVYGASSSYDVDIVKRLPRAGTPVQSEDTPLNMILQLQKGSALFVQESLVQYRVHDSTLSNSFSVAPKMSAVRESESRRPAQLVRHRDLLIYLRDKIIRPLEGEIAIDHPSMDREIRFCERRIYWYSRGPLTRFVLALFAPAGMRRWFLARLLGIRIYSIVKAATIRAVGQHSDLKA